MFPWISLQAIPIGPLTIQVWGLLVAIGIMVSLFWLKKQPELKSIGIEEISDIFFWTILIGFLGARLVHVFFYEPTFFLNNPGEIIQIWHGGLSSFGGIVFGGLAVMYFLSKRKTASGADLSVLSKAGLIGWIFGRVGCFLIHDHTGVICDVGCPLHALAMSPDADTPARLDMSLLELLLLIPLVWIVFFSKYKKKSWIFLLIGGYYGLIRLGLDFYRAKDILHADTRYLGLTPGQYFGILLLVFAVWKAGEYRQK